MGEMIACHCGCGRRYRADFELKYGDTIRTYVTTLDPITLKPPNNLSGYRGLYVEIRPNGPYIQCEICGNMSDLCGHICYHNRPSWVKPYDGR